MRRVLFAVVTILFASGCLCNGCMCPSSNGYPDWQKYREAELADRELKAQPAIIALANYKAAKGRYPRTLEQLVSEGYLTSVPDLASDTDHAGQSGRVEKSGPLRYEATEQDYRLRFQFSFVDQAWTTQKDYRREYKPGPPGGWTRLIGGETRPAAPPTAP